MDAHQELLEILRIGTLAISPYNTQPWRFRLGERRIEVFIVRTKNFFLKLQGVSHMTLGCLLENLEAGARHLGYRPVSRFFDGTLGLDEPCAVVELERDPTLVPSDIRNVRERATNRKPYRSEPLPGPIRERILASSGDGLTVFCSQGDELRQLAMILTELESVRLSNFKLAREAVEYLRFSSSEMAARPEGLDVRTLELQDWMVRILRPIQRRRFHRLLKLVGVVRVAGHRHREQLLASSAIVTYAITDRTSASFVRLGRVIQETLNWLTGAGIESMSVLSGLYLRDVMGWNPEIFSRSETRKLLRARAALERFFGTSERNIVFIVRVGYGERPAFRQPRRPVEELLLDG